MIILTLSPSAYKNEELCQQQYFIEYCLKWRGPSGFAADKGSMIHSAMEHLALAKLAKQNGEAVFEDPLVGSSSVEYQLDDVYNKIFDAYTIKAPQWDWPSVRSECKRWFVQALTYNDHCVDPTRLKIIQPEQRFSIPIEEDWAKYRYQIGEQTIEGRVHLTGVMDLVFEPKPGVYHILDYKTGASRKDWNTGVMQEYSDLARNYQLRNYCYIAKKLFPGKHIITSVFFIRAGGLFTFDFTEQDMLEVENEIKRKVQSIKRNNKPNLIKGGPKGFKCKWCHLSQTTFEDTHIPALTEFRENQFSDIGMPMKKCSQIQYMTQKYGMDHVQNTCMKYPPKGNQ